MPPESSHPVATPPRAVVFDLGKVLLDFDYHIAARTLSPHSRLPAVEFKQVIDQSPLLHRYESGGISTAQFEAEVRQLTGYSGPATHFRDAFADIFAEIPDMIALHRELRDRGIPTYIFSNTNEIAVGHIRDRFPFFGNFDGFVLSYEIGVMNPAPDAYAAVERLTGATGPDLLYLDDRAENIEAGARRGWRTILHADPGITRAEVFRHLPPRSLP